MNPRKRVSGILHLARDGNGLTKCCGKTLFELPSGDRITVRPKNATCGKTPSRIQCPRCKGTGFVEDSRHVGAMFRAKREAAAISLRELAKRWGYSASYVSDLELGKRMLSGRQREAYVRLLDELGAADE